MGDRKTKLNCWEVKRCGRQPQGHSVRVLGQCPAATEERLDGTHEGVNAGRSCWIVAGTMCGGKVQGTFADKYQNCEICEFYQMVKKEEFPNFELSITLLGKLRK